jgi:hypothetical protein
VVGKLSGKYFVSAQSHSFALASAFPYGWEVQELLMNGFHTLLTDTLVSLLWAQRLRGPVASTLSR